MIHQFNPDMLPDSDFVPGELKHLVPGNVARMLDRRRTPVRVLRLQMDTGFFTVEVLDFEDRGVRWDLPFEKVGNFQFAHDSAQASSEAAASLEATVARLDLPLQIEADPSDREATERRIAAVTGDAGQWLAAGSAFLKAGPTLDFSSRTGPDALRSDLGRYMDSHGLRDIEDAFAAQWVSNPWAGEMVKGHAIVLAELGLVEFDGKQIRDPAALTGTLERSRRAEHIVRRLAFIRAVFGHLGLATVVLYRGTAFTGPVRERRNDSFVSTTFSLEVALSLFDDRDDAATGILIRQPVPHTRLFMSYLETEQMNRQYAEAEAVLLGDSTNRFF